MADPVTLALFSSDEQLAELEVRHAAEPAFTMALAWALRQRDPPRCLSLAQAAALADPAWQARLWLIEAERAAAQPDLEAAQRLSERARAAFEAADDRVGVTDLLLLDAILAHERGVSAELVPLAEQALAAAEASGDAHRQAFCRLSLARQRMVSIGLDAEPLCLPLLPSPQEEAQLHPAIAAQLATYRALRALRSTDPAGAIEQYALAHALALRCGNGRLALIAANNLALIYDDAGDSAHALEWGQAMLGLARTVWPALLSHGLSTTCTLLRTLGQLHEARELAQECIQREQSRPASRAGIIARAGLGAIDLQEGRPEEALACFATVLDNPALWLDQRLDTLLDRTEALLRLGRHAEAEASARECLTLDGEAMMASRLFRVRGQLAASWLGLGQAQKAQEAYAAMLDECVTLPSFVPDPVLFEGAARALAAVGRHEQAYEMGQRAAAARETRQGHLTEQRSRALYAQLRNQRAQLEAEHLRRLAEASAARLAALERSHSVLEQLGNIGRELTAQLDAGRALAVLAVHVRSLLHADCLMVYLLDATGQKLECSLCEEHGQPIAGMARELDDPDSLIARCARERQVLLLQGDAVLGQGVQLPGTSLKRSLLYAPLCIGTVLVGVMSVQSEQADAFGAESQLIFDTLCAYAAIALDNARAYQQMREMQRQLRAQERMASLGFVVVGVAHELNTPLGNALLAVTTLKERATDFERRLAEGALRRSDWNELAQGLQQGHALIQSSIGTASRLVSNFRQLAPRRDTEKRASFALAPLCEQQILARSAQMKRSGHRIELDVPADLKLDSYAYAIEQALEILLANALVHGLSEPERHGCIRLEARRFNGEHCRLEVSDDGRGMSTEVLERIFEPFFTTTLGKGSSGLGLSICHSLVEDVLGGRIEAFSEAGKGSRFVMELPLSAP